jgi:membrane-associated phospholipid phosphatase
MCFGFPAGASLNVQHTIRTYLAQNSVPIILVCGMGLVSFVWNLWVGLAWTIETPLTLIVVVVILFPAIAFVFLIIVPIPVMAEIATFLALWSFFPMFGIHLSYLAATLDLPLQDNLLARADAALGFDWRTASAAIWSYPFLIKTLIIAYDSNLYQPPILLCVFAIWGPAGRNREFLTAIALASLVTVVIAAIMPCYGPNEIFGIPSGWHNILADLRSGNHGRLPYAGIVSFPSFHSSMAVILAAVTRGYKYLFVPSVILNGLMLIATVPIGYHYLSDVIAGCVIAILALYSAVHLVKPATAPSAASCAAM